MIYEFALDPELVAQWGKRANYRRFMEKFGLDQRRLVSRFPKRWRQLVWRYFEQLENISWEDERRIEELVRHLTNRMTKRHSSADGVWLFAAEQEHQIRPFYRIVATDNPRQVKEVFIGTNVDNLYDNLPEIPHMLPVDRVPERMSTAISPILRCAEVIAFVEPNFNADRDRFLRSFECYFQAIVDGRCGPDNPRVELHIAVKQLFNPGEERSQADEIRMAKQSILEPCQRRIPRILPAGLALKVVVWRQRPGGVQLHNRYVLTDIGSVQFSHGLDCYDGEDVSGDDEGRPDDEISCLTESVHQKRWRHYMEAPGAFDMVAETSIDGQKRIE